MTVAKYKSRVWTHKIHPIPHPNGWAMECICENLWENWLHYNGTTLYSVKFTYFTIQSAYCYLQECVIIIFIHCVNVYCAFYIFVNFCFIFHSWYALNSYTNISNVYLFFSNLQWPISKTCIIQHNSTLFLISMVCYTPRFNEFERGVYWFHLVRLSISPSVHLWTESCPLCIFNNTHRIHFTFAHLIKQLQKV